MNCKKYDNFKETELGQIPKHWKISKLQNYVTIKGRIGWKGLTISEYTKTGPLIVGGLQIIDNKVAWNECAHITEERYNESPEIMLHQFDILMTKDGTIGKLAFLDDISQKATVAPHIHVIRQNSNELLPLFLFYFFKSPRFQNIIQSKITGSVVPAFTQKDINNTVFLLPPIEEQKSITEFLYALYKKIENLQNQNLVLGNILQIIFKSKFIDFDGITEFEQSELGKIPKNWKVDKLQNFLELTKGVSYRTAELKSSDKALVSLKSIKRYGGYTERGLKSFDGKYKENQIVHENDIIIAQTDLTQDATVIGRPALVRKSSKYDTLIASLDLLIVKLKNDEFPMSYFYCMFLTKQFQNHVYSFTNGTNVLHLDKNGIPRYIFALPPLTTLKKFNKTVYPIIQNTQQNNYQIEKLSKIRDILLPKLMSGEIRV